jgi:ribose transport system substrate-binding protein
MFRKSFSLLIGAGLLFGASGAALAADKIALVVSTLNNPFFVTLRDGAATKAKEMGYDLIVLDSQNDPAKELANVEDVLNKGIKVLLLNPADSDAAKSSVRAAEKKKVPVLTLDRSATGVKVTSHIASDNVAGGKLAGELIAKKLAGKGNVVELQGIPGASAARDRGEGFHKAMRAAPGIKIVASQPADFDRTKGLNVMENILQSQPKIDAVFAHNDEMALGAIKAIQAAKRNIVVVGFDGTDDAVAAIKDGSMLASVAQQPAQIGSLGVSAAAMVIKGKAVPAYTPVPLKLLQR